MKTTKYNGWTNYETWLVKLWIDNDEGSYRYWQQCAEETLEECRTFGDTGARFTPEERAALDLSDKLKDQHEEFIHESVLKPAKMEASFVADLLNAAMSEVNWHEIAENLLEDAKETVA